MREKRELSVAQTIGLVGATVIICMVAFVGWVGYLNTKQREKMRNEAIQFAPRFVEHGASSEPLWVATNLWYFNGPSPMEKAYHFERNNTNLQVMAVFSTEKISEYGFLPQENLPRKLTYFLGLTNGYFAVFRERGK